MRHARLIALLLVGGSALGLAACSSGSSASSEKSTSATTIPANPDPGKAAINAFDVPASVRCGQGTTSTSVSVTYATTGAKTSKLLVDGRPTALSSASGSVDAPVHCDSLPHTFVLFAYDAQGRYTSQQKLVTTTF